MAQHTSSFPVTHSLKVGSLEAVRDHPEFQWEMTQVPAHPLIQDPIIPHLYNCNNPHMYLLPLDSFLTILESIPNQDYKFLHDLALPVFMISSPVIPSLFLSTNIPLPVVHQTHTLISTSGRLHLLFPLPRMLFYQISWLILSFHWCFSKMLSP